MIFQPQDRNVPLILNAQNILHVSNKSVKIHAPLRHVVLMLNVESTTTGQFAPADQTTLVIHSKFAMSVRLMIS